MTSPIFHGPDWTEALHHLQMGPRFRFGSQPRLSVPLAGVYAIWKSESLLYVGMAGRTRAGAAPEETRASPSARAKGLADRLHSHASGRRSGDAFCIYVCDRLVLPDLTPKQIRQVAAGALSLDEKTRAFIREHLTFSYVIVADAKAAQALESVAKAGAMAAGRPLLNPAR